METRVLGDYQIIKKIGRGSLGTVYLAEHRFMRLQYAVKVFPEELAEDRSFIQRFEEEVSRLSSLEHPHIVKIHNVSYAQGTYFLVTDCVVDPMGEATSLSQFLSVQKAPLPEEEVLFILRQVADALDYAHGKRGGEGAIIHRGLKLSNVLIGRGKGGIHVSLSDFGLSKIVGVGAVLNRTYLALAEALKIMDPATLQGEPTLNVGAEPGKVNGLLNSFLQNYAFLAPEQKRHEGKKGVVGIGADVYAFGILAYYLLTREFPEGIFQLPSERVPEYRLNWDSLISSCLQYDPQKRPESLLDALDEVEQPASDSDSTPRSLSSIVAQTIERGGVPSIATPVATPYLPPGGTVHTKRAPLAEAQPLLQENRAQRSGASDTEPKKFRLVEPAMAAKAKEGAVATAESPKKEASVLFTRQAVPITSYQIEPRGSEMAEPLQSEMVAIDGGIFTRGSVDGNRDEMPRHKIRLKGFAMDIHPVTNEQFARFLDRMEGEKDEHNHDLIILRDSRIRRTSGRLIIESGYSKHPVVGVTWYGAVAYAKWVGKRLPTESEWEVAARGGDDDAIYPTGDRIERSQANFFSSDTTPVMSYQPNEYGLYDMAGNIYEWCQDWYGYNSYEQSAQEPEQPAGPLQGVYRVLRGGCWKSLVEDLRCSHRHRNNPGTVNGTYGFRCSADL